MDDMIKDNNIPENQKKDDVIILDCKAFNEMMIRIEQSLNIKLAMHLEKVFAKIEVRQKYDKIELFKELFLAPKEAAEALQCNIRTLQRYTEGGKINVIKRDNKVWYKIADIIEFLERNDNNLPDITRQ